MGDFVAGRSFVAADAPGLVARLQEGADGVDGDDERGALGAAHTAQNHGFGGEVALVEEEGVFGVEESLVGEVEGEFASLLVDALEGDIAECADVAGLLVCPVFAEDVAAPLGDGPVLALEQFDEVAVVAGSEERDGAGDARRGRQRGLLFFAGGGAVAADIVAAEGRVLVVAGHLGLGADLCEPLAEQDDLVARRGELADIVVGDAGDAELLLGAGVEQPPFDLFVARLGVGFPDEHVGAELALMVGHGVLAGLEFEDAEVLFALEHDVELAVEAVAGREAAGLGEVSGAERVLRRGPLGERGQVAEDLVAEVGEPGVGDAGGDEFETLRGDDDLHALMERAAVARVDVALEEVAQELVNEVSDDDGLADVFLLAEVDKVAAGAGAGAHPFDLDDVGDGEGEVGLDDEDRSGVDGVEGVALLVVAGDGAQDGDLGAGR